MRNVPNEPAGVRNVDGLEIAEDWPGLPDVEREARMAEAVSVVRRVMEPNGGTVTHSPLGPGWSSDLDVYVESSEVPAMAAAAAAGWVPLDNLLGHLGYPGRGRWAVVASGRVLARADVQVGAAPSALRSVLGRIERLGRVGLREALEIRHIAGRDGLGGVGDEKVLAAAAAIETELGGSVLQAWAHPTGDGGVSAENGTPRTDRLASIRHRFRPRLGVALSGVDGAGKSSLVEGLGDALRRCGIPCSVVWTRPGMRLRLLEKLAKNVKRILGIKSDGLSDLASGAKPEEVRSRRGIIGWVWSLLVTLAYVWDVRKRSLTARDVVIYDRHLLDAVASIESLYDGVNTRFQVWLVRSLIPQADASIWLDVPAEVAVRRKTDDVFNLLLVEKQLERYRANASTIKGLIRIDGTSSPDEVALSAFRAAAGAIDTARISSRARFAAWIRARR